MTTIKTNRHIEIDKGHQRINLTEFTMEVDERTGNDHIVATFMRSTQFSFDSLQDRIKAEPDKPYLT